MIGICEKCGKEAKLIGNRGTCADCTSLNGKNNVITFKTDDVGARALYRYFEGSRYENITTMMNGIIAEVVPGANGELDDYHKSIMEYDRLIESLGAFGDRYNGFLDKVRNDRKVFVTPSEKFILALKGVLAEYDDPRHAQHIALAIKRMCVGLSPEEKEALDTLLGTSEPAKEPVIEAPKEEPKTETVEEEPMPPGLDRAEWNTLKVLRSAKVIDPDKVSKTVRDGHSIISPYRAGEILEALVDKGFAVRENVKGKFLQVQYRPKVMA